HRRPPDSAGAGGDRRAAHLPGEGPELAGPGLLLRTLQVFRDQLGAEGITGHQHVGADLALGEPDVVFALRHRPRSLAGLSDPRRRRGIRRPGAPDGGYAPSTGARAAVAAQARSAEAG